MEQPPKVPGYDVAGPVGDGATATVWRARRRLDHLPVALKVVRPGHADVETALQEAGLLARVRHPHVVHLHDVLPLPDPDTGRPASVVMVTQLAAGGSLAQVLARRGLLSPGELVTVLQPLAGTLADLHHQGVVHGDLSTGNILFRSDGMPLLADLGTARVAGERAAAGLGTGAEEGMVAPEVVEGFPATRESDVYQLGALAWLALVGTPPGPGFDRPDLTEVGPALSSRLVELVDRCMAPQPEDRPDAEEVAVALLTVAAPEPIEVAPDADPGHGLTQRLRQVAQEDEAEAAVAKPRRQWWQRRGRRTHVQDRCDTSVAPTTDVSHRSGTGVAGRWSGGRDDDVDHARRGRPERSRRGAHRPEHVDADPDRPSRGVLVGAALVVLLLVGTGVSVLVPPLLSRLSPDPAAVAPRQPAAEASAGPTAGAGRGPGQAEQEVAGEEGNRPAADEAEGSGQEEGEHADGQVLRTVQDLADGRARAWQRTDPDLLDGVLAPGSPAEAAERSELQRAREAGLAYPTVAFHVERAEVRASADDSMTVDATVVRSPLEARDELGWVLREPERTDRVEVELTRVDGAWLLWSWQG